MIIRFAAKDQFAQLEACAEALKGRRLLGGVLFCLGNGTKRL